MDSKLDLSYKATRKGSFKYKDIKILHPRRCSNANIFCMIDQYSSKLLFESYYKYKSIISQCCHENQAKHHITHLSKVTTTESIIKYKMWPFKPCIQNVSVLGPQTQNTGDLVLIQI